jgi:hypothetical protein
VAAVLAPEEARLHRAELRQQQLADAEQSIATGVAAVDVRQPEHVRVARLRPDPVDRDIRGRKARRRERRRCCCYQDGQHHLAGKAGSRWFPVPHLFLDIDQRDGTGGAAHTAE